MSVVTSVIREDARLVAEDLRQELAPLAGATLLVTGAGGFLGSFLLDVLAALDRDGPASRCHVLAVDNFQVGMPARVRHLVDRPSEPNSDHPPVNSGAKAPRFRARPAPR